MIDDKNLPVKREYLLYLADVPKHKWASKAVRIDEDTSKRWRDADPDFADQCEQVLSEWVRKNLKKSKPEFQLERLLKDDFSEKKEVENFNFEVTRRNEDTSQHVRTDEPTPETTGSAG